ncbi:hypothetical protein [Neobacillus ginsengisoli]|uniref:Uncharacterized protein n=1 Tax=Neobacillus ginsengisoli TaxID=904295 RepID=A0ABT9XW56_9BACI|nr:hypothetical protein [Neobacillus ginsengisoli]MDQ0199806.1 hypothetical protein [Neobacillus ginsengisoli]
MSFTDFHDIYRICSDYDEAGLSGDMIKFGIDKLSSDSVTDSLITRSNRWWEYVEKEILKENKESVRI